MPTPAIRPAALDDIPPITEIYAEVVIDSTASFEILPPDKAEMARRMTALFDGDHPYLVAESGGRVVGYGYAGPYRDRHAYVNTVEDSIYLASDARGQGTGGALLRRLIEEAEARGFRQMIAVIGDAKHVASIRLHKAAGFEIAGTLKDIGYKHERWLDSVLMQRTLGLGARAKPWR